MESLVENKYRCISFARLCQIPTPLRWAHQCWVWNHGFMRPSLFFSRTCCVTRKLIALIECLHASKISLILQRLLGSNPRFAPQTEATLIALQNPSFPWSNVTLLLLATRHTRLTRLVELLERKSRYGCNCELIRKSCQISSGIIVSTG